MNLLQRICAVISVMGLFALTLWVCDLRPYTGGPSGGSVEVLALWAAFLMSGFVTWIATDPV